VGDMTVQGEVKAELQQ